MTLKVGHSGRVRPRGPSAGTRGPTNPRSRPSRPGLAADLAFARGLGVSLFGGPASSDPEGTIFRNLPISLEYRGGRREGARLRRRQSGKRSSLSGILRRERGRATSSLRGLEDLAHRGLRRRQATPGDGRNGPSSRSARRLTYKALTNFTPYARPVAELVPGRFPDDGEPRRARTGRRSGSSPRRAFCGSRWARPSISGAVSSSTAEAGVIPVKGRDRPGRDRQASLRILAT